MREHIRREARQYVQAVWWLAPVAFATLALAAVVMNEKEAPTAGLPMAASAAASIIPASLPAPAAASSAQAAEPVVEVEHIQAF